MFLAVMEVVFHGLKARWSKLNTRRSGAYYGVVIDSETDPLSNLRFADDVILFASSPGDIGKMIDDLSKEAGKFGLKIHTGKTVVLSNRSVDRSKTMKCGSAEVKVASLDDTERYLGRKCPSLNSTKQSSRIGWRQHGVLSSSSKSPFAVGMFL